MNKVLFKLDFLGTLFFYFKKTMSTWEDKTLTAAQEVLKSNFKIYSFQISYHRNEPRIQIMLDKLNDPHGSPNIDDCEEFSSLLGVRLQVLSEEIEFPDDYSLEVSSPGADRRIQFPEDLERFKSFPLKVIYSQDEKVLHKVLVNNKIDENMTYWHLADVKTNRKSGEYNKRNRNKEYLIPLADVQDVYLFLDY